MSNNKSSKQNKPIIKAQCFSGSVTFKNSGHIKEPPTPSPKVRYSYRDFTEPY